MPGELKGFSTIYNLYGGGVSWESLFEPTIRLCEDGIEVSERLAINIKNNIAVIKNDTLLRYNTRLLFLRTYFVNFRRRL